MNDRRSREKKKKTNLSFFDKTSEWIPKYWLDIHSSHNNPIQHLASKIFIFILFVKYESQKKLRRRKKKKSKKISYILFCYFNLLFTMCLFLSWFRRHVCGPIGSIRWLPSKIFVIQNVMFLSVFRCVIWLFWSTQTTTK